MDPENQVSPAGATPQAEDTVGETPASIPAPESESGETPPGAPPASESPEQPDKLKAALAAERKLRRDAEAAAKAAEATAAQVAADRLAEQTRTLLEKHRLPADFAHVLEKEPTLEGREKLLDSIVSAVRGTIRSVVKDVTGTDGKMPDPVIPTTGRIPVAEFQKRHGIY